jgi:hypothetical protein
MARGSDGAAWNVLRRLAPRIIHESIRTRIKSNAVSAAFGGGANAVETDSRNNTPAERAAS